MRGDDYKAIGGRIRQAREAAGLSARDMMRVLGITNDSTYSRYESGARRIPLPDLEKIADYLGPSVDYFLGRLPPDVSQTSPLASIIHEAASLPQEMQDYLAGVLRLLVNHELGNAEGRRKLIQIEEVIRKAAAREDPKLRKVRGTAEEWEQITNIVAGRGDAEEEVLKRPNH